MGKSKPTNIAASVRDRLLNLAKERGEDFNFVLARYAIERLMYRLSRSGHRDSFVLKGATLFHVWGVAAHRATKDVDLLGRGDNTPTGLIQVLQDVIETDVEPDGIQFLASSLRAQAIAPEAEYKGVRLTMTAKLGTARIAVQVDVGFGDAATPKPKLTELPVLLDLPAPKIRTYAKETVVAEKFQAMVHLGLLNSRMKDYFDLWLMANTFEFDGETLATAIAATFKQRRTPMPVELPDGLGDEFVGDERKLSQWNGFVRRVAQVHQGVSLANAVADLRQFLMPVAEAIGSGAPYRKRWRPGTGWS